MMNYRLKSLFLVALAFPMLLSAQVRVEQLLEKDGSLPAKTRLLSAMNSLMTASGSR